MKLTEEQSNLLKKLMTSSHDYGRAFPDTIVNL